MDLSYAQNLEDYHLAQVFAGKTDGFYIDVGAGHPVADNVSFHFYLQGWRGIVVEPQERLCALYEHLRPRDIAASVLIGAESGRAKFHEVDRLHGFSTTVERHARGAAKFGASFRTSRKFVLTLASLCDAHRVEEIDFLKVDVEGAERDVLAGADWRRFRPKVVLVEAVAPGTMAPSHEEWEPILLRQRLRLCLLRRAQPLLRRRRGRGPEGALPADTGAVGRGAPPLRVRPRAGEPAAPRPCAREGARRGVPRGAADA